MTDGGMFRWAPDDPIASRMIFVSATAPQQTRNPTLAWDLYQGGCLPQLRARLADRPDLRSRVRLISAEHGVLHPTTELVCDDARPLTDTRAADLRDRTRTRLHEELRRYGVPREIMLLAEHPYGLVVSDVLHIPGLLPYTALSLDRPGEQWPLIATYLDRWGWC